MGLLLRCHASAGAVSSRCFAVCAGFGLYGSCDHQSAGARNDAPCSSVCILGKCGSRNGDFTSFGGEKPGCLIVGVLGSFRPGCSIEGNGQIRENRVKLVCDHDQINRGSRNIPSVFDDKGIG